MVTATGHLTLPRVDERSMPSGTTLRFILLVVLIVVSSALMTMLTLGSGFGAASTSRTGSTNGCELAAGGDPSRIGGAVPQADTSAYRECLARYGPKDTSPWWVSEVWPLLMVVVAAVLMWTIPAWKARRGRVVPLEAVDGDGAVRGAVAELATAAGLRQAPRVVVDPTAVSAGAVVFGSNRRPVVCLHGGLLVRARTDPEGFRAVLLHEFAHIRNGDVTLTYVTVALWRAFLGMVLLPYVALMLSLAVWMALFALEVRAPLAPETMASIDSTGLLIARLLGHPAVLVLLVHLARADVLRTREVHADLTAVRWGAAPDHWAAHAASPGGAAVPRGVWRLWASFAELLRTHPRWDLRREALADPAELFGVRALPMFLTGVAAPVINAQVWLYSGRSSIPLLEEASWAVTAALVAGVAGVALWRAAAHAVLTGRREPSGVRAGLWLGAGMTAGELVAYQSGINTWLPGNPVMLLFPFAAGAAFGWWTTQCARLLTRTWPRRIRPMVVLGAVAGAVLLVSWFAWWQVFGVTYAREGHSTARAAAPAQDQTPATPSPKTRALQVYAWEVYGGNRLEQRFITINRELEPLIQNPHATDESRTRAQCAQFRRFAHDAARYFPVPDPRAQTFWRRTQTYATRGAANCDRALDRASGRLLATALNEFTDALESMGAMSVRNQSIIKRAGILGPRRS
ncbi:hypothetical protein GCM10010446_04360 [Streptomyces enissocaesilis]|uniref:Peptidase M48 domain-containing protein n=1 Tax=Streptomyces enissocaesilis TaxID=332589 RepID=A0ABP6J7K2_9ACTN